MTAASRPVGGEPGATTEASTDGRRGGPAMPFGDLVPRVLRTVWLVGVWVLLWGTFSWADLLGGLVVAALVLSVFPLPGITGQGRLRAAGLLRVTGRVASDLVVSSAQVAWQSVRPGPPIRSSIVAVRLRARSEMLTALLVELLSLVPGSVVVEADADAGMLWAHVLGADTDAAADAYRAQVHELERALLASGVTAVGVDPSSHDAPDAPEGTEDPGSPAGGDDRTDGGRGGS